MTIGVKLTEKIGMTTGGFCEESEAVCVCGEERIT
jgi:hypothetical protein